MSSFLLWPKVSVLNMISWFPLPSPPALTPTPPPSSPCLNSQWEYEKLCVWVFIYHVGTFKYNFVHDTLWPWTCVTLFRPPEDFSHKKNSCSLLPHIYLKMYSGMLHLGCNNAEDGRVMLLTQVLIFRLILFVFQEIALDEFILPRYYTFKYFLLRYSQSITFTWRYL